MVNRFFLSALISALTLVAAGACERKRSDPAVPRLAPEILWNLDLPEPSGLVALSDERLLSVGDGGRGLIYEIVLDYEELSLNPALIDLRALSEKPRTEFPNDRAPDLEAVAAAPDGTLFLGLEYWNEIWRIGPDRKHVSGTWTLPPIEPQGGLPECLGPKENHGLEGLAYDPVRKWLLAAHERCPPALVLFAENDSKPLRAYPRAEFNRLLAREAQPGAEPPQVGTFSGLAWTGEPGAFIVIDRLRRELLAFSVADDADLSLTGRWSFSGVFDEPGLHQQFGNAEGVAVAHGALYLLTDPGENGRAQLARFPWPLRPGGAGKRR